MMTKWNYFSAAKGNWRARALQRLKQEEEKRGSEIATYVAKRVAVSRWGTFERRRWAFVQRHLASQSGKRQGSSSYI